MSELLLYGQDAVTSGAISKTLVDLNGEVRSKTQMEISEEVAELWKSAPEELKILYRMFAEGEFQEPEEKQPVCEPQDPESTSGASVTISAEMSEIMFKDGNSEPTVDRNPRPRFPDPNAKIPRPPNAFILYRRDILGSGAVATEAICECCGAERLRTQGEISKDISFLWKNAPDDVKSHYNGLAEERKKEHKEKYPDYRFCPKASKKTRSTSRRLQTKACSHGPNNFIRAILPDNV
ncbi:slightly ste11-like protein [Marasmius crinis-equi]|uniref:Slightly ste11-like protein n=1 Tax=Marasmius crinis-equi TaxID=585013 RepID=A0ABR3F8B0_9AGAR